MAANVMRHKNKHLFWVNENLECNLNDYILLRSSDVIRILINVEGLIAYINNR